MISFLFKIHLVQYTWLVKLWASSLSSFSVKVLSKNVDSENALLLL